MNVKKVPFGILFVAALMILFGLMEVATGFRHHFAGISTSQSIAFTWATAGIGTLYIVGGLLILTLKRCAARLAIFCLLAHIVGRVLLVMTGLYPMKPFKQIIAISLGTLIAAAFAIYIGSKRKVFT